MARLPRLVLPGQVHLVVQRARAGIVVFADGVDRQAYRDALGLALAEGGISLHAYALASDAVRLLLTPTQAGALARCLQSTGRRHVRAFNARHATSGSPWDGRFRSTVIESPAWLLRCMRHVETAAGASADASSAAHHLGHRIDPLISEHAAFWPIGNTPFEREAAYRGFLEQPVPKDEPERIESAAQHGWALGSAEFVAQATAQAGRRAAPAARGRPRRAAVNSR